jgi:hypothetical protein
MYYYSESHSTSSPPFTVRPLLLEKPICAIQLLFTEKGEQRLGLLAQLGSGTNAEICGPGFNERTVRVRVNGQSYFVFLQDIQVPEVFS